MHEYAIVQALLAQVEAAAQAAGATAVRTIRVRIGELAGVEVDLLRTAYATFRERGPCRTAELAVEAVAARWACPRCRRPRARGEVLRCPECSLPARLVAGDELILDRIEMEVP